MRTLRYRTAQANNHAATIFCHACWCMDALVSGWQARSEQNALTVAARVARFRVGGCPYPATGRCRAPGAPLLVSVFSQGALANLW